MKGQSKHGHRNAGRTCSQVKIWGNTYVSCPLLWMLVRNGPGNKKKIKQTLNKMAHTHTPIQWQKSLRSFFPVSFPRSFPHIASDEVSSGVLSLSQGKQGHIGREEMEGEHMTVFGTWWSPVSIINNPSKAFHQFLVSLKSPRLLILGTGAGDRQHRRLQLTCSFPVLPKISLWF